MQVIFGDEQKELVGDRFTLLELDTFMQEGMPKPITAYAVIGADDLKLPDLFGIESLSKVHNTMLQEYRKKNWEFCRQAMEHLKGQWNGSLDSFYDILSTRISELEQSKLDANWDGILYRW